MPDYFTVLHDRAEFRPIGKMSLEGAVKLVSEAIAHATVLGVRQLLIVGHELEVLEQPSDMDRIYMGQEWARANSGSAMRIAVVVPVKLIHPQKIGLLVASNRGLVGEVFVNEDEAVAWLDRRHG